MKVVVTGAAGFLGWHTRLRLRALTEHEVVPVARDQWADLSTHLADADAVIHIAGVNRGDDRAVHEGNLSLARDLAGAISRAGHAMRVVYANSIQDGNGSAYGSGKAEAREVLAAAMEATGGSLVDVRLPNLFGEHGRPAYNSFVATFVHAVRDGVTPQVNDAKVGLLHVQSAAQALIDGLGGDGRRIDAKGTPVGVQEVLDLLQEFKASYDTGEIPDLSSPLRIDLFNTYRASLFPQHAPIALTPHSDPRGTYVELVRVRGGGGQSSFSTTVPGVTRGEHFHLKKIERFAVISGQARIELRKMFTEDVFEFDVSGDTPCAIDMPVGWVHNITNTGDDTLVTQFWSHALHDPADPDTYYENVRAKGDPA
ncbi:capsular polysaccharide biosynthesis protein CapF [Knoellia sinensis KCTC 19936]|uniref:Capsular polysaccharide biosynthesis protein CapF n=1 Tax=Knoellia sinensis KCTC 19936 TaxID=1385520 RepID=A0A0A0J733_9MICO|nr:NAD-dependent epimerase/dehydratase family protein [Knoellia sinensis]KGN32978.1 capsular polysaccharide biosynthesis protein CapF [Knoellia sinensis KCTC 19936]